jgi:hypothetical protein
MPELGQVNRAVKELHDEGVMKGSVLLLLLFLVPSPSPSKRRAGKVRFWICDILVLIRIRTSE